MQYFIVLLGFLVVLALLAGGIAFLLGYGVKNDKAGEWPVLVEAEHSHQVHNLKGVLEQKEVPVIVEEESTEAGGIPTTLTRNVLRVPPGQESRALEVMRNSDLDTDHFRIRVG